MAAIPSDLRKKLGTPKYLHKSNSTISLSSESTPIDLAECAVNIIIKYLTKTKTPQSSQPALKHEKSILPTPLQPGGMANQILLHISINKR